MSASNKNTVFHGRFTSIEAVFKFPVSVFVLKRGILSTVLLLLLKMQHVMPMAATAKVKAIIISKAL